MTPSTDQRRERVRPHPSDARSTCRPSQTSTPAQAIVEPLRTVSLPRFVSCRHSLSSGVRSPRGGVTLIDVIVALTIVGVAVLSLLGLLTTSLQMQVTNRESTSAVQAARRELESLRALPFDRVFAERNAEPGDDPDGPGTAPGNAFDVYGLSPQLGDPDGRVGEILFPVTGRELREDCVDPALGMPRDLDLDRVIDSEDCAGNYRLLPVRVRLRWRSSIGPREYELFSLMREP